MAAMLVKIPNIHNWRAGASQPSRSNEPIFLYICIYIYLFLNGVATHTIMLYVSSKFCVCTDTHTHLLANNA